MITVYVSVKACKMKATIFSEPAYKRNILWQLPDIQLTKCINKLEPIAFLCLI
jgi:hypothetical protein